MITTMLTSEEHHSMIIEMTDREKDQKIDTVRTEETKETEADQEVGMMTDLHEKDEIETDREDMTIHQEEDMMTPLEEDPLGGITDKTTTREEDHKKEVDRTVQGGKGERT